MRCSASSASSGSRSCSSAAARTPKSWSAPIRKELSQQLSSLGVATKADLKKLEAKVDALAKAAKAKAKTPAKKAAAAKKA